MSAKDIADAVLNPVKPSPDWRDPLPDLDPAALERDGSCRLGAGVAAAPDGETEDLLNAMIGECRFLMHEVAFRSMLQSSMAGDRLDFLRSAMSLADTGANVARAIAQLRAVPLVADGLVDDLAPKPKAKTRRREKQ